MLFVFQQKTAYEMRISDWSSDVCSSDLIPDAQRLGPVGGGFGVAMETLIIERYSATDPAANGPSIARALADATRMTRDGRPLIEDGRVRERIARNFATQAALASIHRRALLSIGRAHV